MKNCRILKDNIIAYLEGRLDDKLRKEIEAHLADHPQCASYLERFRQVYSASEEQPKIQPSGSFYARLQERIDRHEDEYISLSNIWAYFTGKTRPVLASLALLIAVGIGYWIGSGVTINGNGTAYGEDDYLVEYYGVDTFEPGAGVSITSFYEQIMTGEDADE